MQERERGRETERPAKTAAKCSRFLNSSPKCLVQKGILHLTHTVFVPATPRAQAALMTAVHFRRCKTEKDFAYTLFCKLNQEQLRDVCWFGASCLAAQGKGLWRGSCSLLAWAAHRQRCCCVSREPVPAVVSLRTSPYIKQTNK